MQLYMEKEELKTFKQEQIIMTESLAMKLVMFFFSVTLFLEMFGLFLTLSLSYLAMVAAQCENENVLGSGVTVHVVNLILVNAEPSYSIPLFTEDQNDSVK